MALSLDGHTSGATSVTDSTYQTGTLTTSTGSGQIVACIFNNSSGVTSVRGVEKLNAIGGPNRTARLAIVATLVGALSATPVSAFEAQPDKRLTGAITIISDDWTKELEADLSLLASDMWGTQKRLEEKGFRVDRGNKSPTGWWLTASNRNTGHSIKVQSDGTKLVVTPEG
jgi:hypothetical protein